MRSSVSVYLLGSGPGGAELMTTKGVELLSIADVIIYDALVDESIYRLFSPNAKLIYVGKRAGAHALQQEEINSVIISEARQLSRGIVVRLKGGDPFVFGRGGEEMIALHEAGIRYEVVPGVTAGIAAPAYCGVPVTHRGISRSVTLITAFTKDGGLPDLDWEAYSRLEGTLVFYMSMRVVPQIVSALLAVGMPRERKAAIISQGTRYCQSIESHSLDFFTSERFNYESFTPGLFVVGEVLDFASRYAWYKPSSLAGKRILITRSEGSTSELTEQFLRLGALPRVLPTFELEANFEDEDLLPTNTRKAILALTSPNSVAYLFDCLERTGMDARYLARFDALAAIGPATAKALKERGFVADLVAPEHTALGFARAILERYGDEYLVYHPTSDKNSGEFESILDAAKVHVLTKTLYRNKPISYERDELQDLLSGGIDWITFCSSSAVHNFVGLLRMYDLETLLPGIRLAAIGPSTRSTLMAYGYEDVLMPNEATLPALVEAMVLADTLE